MPQGIVWYREHDEQEMTHYKADPLQPFRYNLIAEELLNDQECPLKEKSRALNKIKIKKAKAILSAVKHHSIKKALELKKESGMSLMEVLGTILR